MKPALIVAAMIAVMVGFVALIGMSKDREQQARLDRMDANFEASRMQLACEHHRTASPDDPAVQAACGLVDAVASQPVSR